MEEQSLSGEGETVGGSTGKAFVAVFTDRFRKGETVAFRRMRL
jgi:hypothetical protein